MAAEEDKKGAFAPMMESGVHAGFPSPAQDYINSFIDLNKELVRHPAATFFARVVGDLHKAFSLTASGQGKP